MARHEKKDGGDQFYDSGPDAPPHLNRIYLEEREETMRKLPYLGEDVNRLRRCREFEKQCLQQDQRSDPAAKPAQYRQWRTHWSFCNGYVHCFSVLTCHIYR